MGDCAHTKSTPRVRGFANARKLQRQCDDCFEGVGRPVKLAEVPGSRRWQSWRQAPAKPKPNSKRRAYDEFMRSPEWHAQHVRVLERDEYTCQGENCQELATQAHHVKYATPIENTPDEWIVASCARCNRNERETRWLNA